LMQTFNNKSAESVAYLMIGSSLRHWSHPLKIASEDYNSSYRVGLESSNLQYAAYAFGHNMYCRFYQSVFLEKLLDEITESLAFSRKYKNQWAIDLFLGGQIILAELIGKTVDLKEADYLQQCHEHKNWQVICIYNILKSQLLFIYEQWEQAFYYSQQADAEIINVAPQGLLPYVHHCFIHALLLIKRYRNLPQEQKQTCWDKISQYQQQLGIWAQNNPVNFLPLSCLVNAEIDRLSDNFLKAMDNYDRAITAAKNNESIQAEALANELAAKFYLDWGKEKVASGYMQEAYYSYAKWGAKVKVANLEKTYPKLLKPILQHPQPTNLFEETIGRGAMISTHTSTGISEALDLKTLIKASQVISSEIELNKLLVTLLEIVVANAGANKCVLLLIQDELLQVVAQLKDGQSSEILPSIALEFSQDVPINLVNNVKRNLKHIVLEDARMSSRFIADIYIQTNQPKSVLCSPIINQGKLIGILYLENNLTVRAFTSERVELLNLICSQAAISLENARLYQAAQQALTDLQNAQIQIIQSEKMSALGNLVAGIAHEINNPVSFLSGNIQPALDYINDLFHLLDLVQKKYPQLDSEVQQKIEAIELDYIREDLPKLVSSMSEGV
ncbi:MAG: GAF domain-containing protein, partial [Planktothrix sp.]